MPEAGGGKLIGFLNPDLTLGSGLDLAPYLLSYGREALGCKEGSQDIAQERVQDAAQPMGSGVPIDHRKKE